MTAAWKSSACACGARHPSWSANGSHGPWRCQSCHTLAIKAAIEIPTSALGIDALEPVLKQEGLLL